MSVRLACLAVIVAGGTARGEPPPPVDHDALADRLVAELNLVRADPRGYARHVAALRRYYDGKLWNLPGRDPVRTREGVAALDEAVRALRRARKGKRLVRDAGMSRAAAEHVADIGATGTISHDGSDGSDPFRRLARYGLVIGTGSENIGVAFRDPRLFVIHQLIDDGVAGRGHRDNILFRNYTRIGVACGPHKKYGVVCVMDFAEAFEPVVRPKGHSGKS